LPVATGIRVLLAKLWRVVRPAQGGLASSPGASEAHELFGSEPTSCIVSVDADRSGHARVWRRVGGRVELSEHTFPNWFLTSDLELLAHLSARYVDADWLRAAKGHPRLDEPLVVVELDPPSNTASDAYRYLALTTNLQDVETSLVETVSKRDGDEAQSLGDLKGLVLTSDPVEQFLTLTGRTYFKEMAFEDLRRFQFDLETTGLNEDRDRIFMISMRDSTGWRACLDTTQLDEAELLRTFVQTLRERDPDVLENHNIFGFDLSFLMRRATRLGIPLGIGRDGSEPRLVTDVFDSGERAEPFLRWRIVGREVIDTQHAVRRYGLAAPDMRRHGLKEAARYFGFARDDREYVPGPEIWATYRTDPERIRRYAADDVDEVDGLSQRLLPPVFDLTRMLPRSYERVAADMGAAALWELLLVRAYLCEGRAVVAPTPRLQRTGAAARSELFAAGVVGPSTRAVVRPLLPSVLADRSIGAANDDLRVMPRVLRQLLNNSDDPAAMQLAAAAPTYLASPYLFADPQAAGEGIAIARDYMERVVEDLRQRQCSIIEVDGEHVLLALPVGWDASIEHAASEAAAAYLPAGVELEFGPRYEALYARGPGTSITLGADGSITLVGAAFRAGRLERFGDAFIHGAAECVLRGDAAGLRRVFLGTVHQLRSGQVSLDDLCVQVTLHKSPAQYRRGGTHEEPYEVLLAAGIRSWRVGQRIRYFRARGGEPRLRQEADGQTSADADTEYYVQRLCALYCQQFAQAFAREDFARIFRLPPGVGPYDEDLAPLRDIRTVVTPIAS
jgi:DNA polymerase, archaea type